MSERRLLVSSSGGETSACMTHWILENLRDRYDVIRVCFANTGQENEETLEFVRDCDEHFGFETVWIEGVQFPGERRSPGFKIVDFETADRAGQAFEAAIAKYGIPNQKFKDCTRNLKRKPIETWARSIGWANGSYDLAIGIRIDEIDRVSAEAHDRRIIYPFVKMRPMTKPQINSWWAAQPFRLQLKGYQGNCKWCWKKSRRKHLTLIGERPEIFDFPRRMEEQYGLTGPEFRKDMSKQERPLPEGYRRTFFRGNCSVADLFADYATREAAGTLVPAPDDAQVFDPSLDLGGGCEESCEVYSDEDEGDDE